MGEHQQMIRCERQRKSGSLVIMRGARCREQKKIKPHERSSFGLWVSAFAEGRDQTSSVVFVRE